MAGTSKGIHVKVSIDSTDSLSDAIRVIGALYDVTLAQVENNGGTVVPAEPNTATRASSAASSSRSTRRANGKPSGGSTRRARSKTAATAATASQIREWALANGHVVSSRGTIPAAVRSAFDAAN